MLSPFLNRTGNILVSVSVMGAIAVSAVLGGLQIASQYANRLSGARKTSSLADRNTLVLEYLRTKFVPRGYPSSPEWSITTNSAGQVRIASRVAANRGLASFVPIRVVQKKMESGQCVSLGSELREFSGEPSSDSCEFDTYAPDIGSVSSLQDSSSLISSEKQKAFVGVFDLSALSTEDQDSVLNGNSSIFGGRAIASVGVSFERYTPNGETGGGELSVSFENGDLGQISVLPRKEITFLESFTGRLLSVSVESSDLEDETGNCRPLLFTEVGCTGRGTAFCSNPDNAKAFSERPFCGPSHLGRFIIDASASVIRAVTTNYYLSSSGDVIDGSGSRLGSEPRLGSANYFRGKWYFLKSDGTVFRGTDISSFSSFEQIRCLNLERAQVLALGATPNLICQ